MGPCAADDVNMFFALPIKIVRPNNETVALKGNEGYYFHIVTSKGNIVSDNWMMIIRIVVFISHEKNVEIYYSFCTKPLVRNLSILTNDLLKAAH